MAKKIKCYVCLGNPRGGKCIICGLTTSEYHRKRKKNDGKKRAPDGSIVLTHEENRIAWLQETWNKLKQFNQATTQDFKLDEEIKVRVGPWMPESDRIRGIWEYMKEFDKDTTGIEELDNKVMKHLGVS